MADPVSLAIGIGGALLSAVLAPRLPDQHGPRLSDVNVMTVSPGNAMIRHWGTMKLPGQLLWTSKLIETEHVEKHGSKGLFGMGKKQKVYTYTYSADLAVGVCQGPVQRINRIWANHKLLWVNPDLQGTLQQTFDQAYYAELDRLVNQAGQTWYDEAYCAAFVFAFNNYRPDDYSYDTREEALDYIMAHPGVQPHVSEDIPPPDRDAVRELLERMFETLKDGQTYNKAKVRFKALHLYMGSEEQLPNARIEAYLGVGNVPAFRGLCYFVLQDLQLEDFGNSIPTFAIEVVRKIGDVQLTEIISDICRECGLEDGEFDGIGYMPADTMLPGFAVTQAASGRQLLNNLQAVYPFEAAESAYRLVFSWVNQRPKAIIRREDFAARPQEGERVPAVEITRSHDFDLPRRMNLKFQEPARAYSTNTVFATRQATESNTDETIDMPIALTRAMAKTQVEEMLAMRFTARRTYKVVLPRKYVVIEPGDPVLVPDPDDPTGYEYQAWRCVEVAIGNNGLLEMTFVDHYHHGSVAALTEEDLPDDDPDDGLLPTSSPTQAYMLDIPLLFDDDDDDIGFYVALSGSASGWPGGDLLLDVSSGGTFTAFGITDENELAGSSWYAIARSQELVPHGFALTALPPAVPGLWDYGSKVRVLLLNREIELSSVDPDDALVLPLNFAVIGDELVQFAKAVDLGNGLWELSHFLRGLRGTDHLVGGHVPGERFVRLNQNVIERVTHTLRQLNRPATYRAVTSGDDMETARSFSFVNTGNSLRPFAPVVFDAARSPDGAIRFKWSPRARQHGGLVSGQETVIDQPFEVYEIDVHFGAAVLRTVELGAVREWTYPAADHLADFGALQSKVKFSLYQMGATIGRGFPRTLEA